MIKNKRKLLVLAFISVVVIICGYFFLKNRNVPTITNNSNTTQKSALINDPKPSLSSSCVDDPPEGEPVISSLSSTSGPIGTRIEINGCNLAGFEGDKDAWIENSKGEKGILYGENGSTGKLIITTLKPKLCQEDNQYSGLPCEKYLTLSPGSYKIFATPWLKMSNQATFTIK